MAELTVPKMDFSPLANLPNIYKQAQQQRMRDQTLAALGQGGGADADTLIKSGDLSLAQLGLNLRNQQMEKERQAQRDAISDQHWQKSYDLQARAAARAAEEKPIIKEITDPNTGQTSFVRIMPNSGRYDTLRPPPGTAPAPQPNPGLNPNSPFGKALMKADADRLGDYMDGAKAAQEGKATLDQIENLRKDAFTGPVAGRVANLVGYPANQALETASNSLSLDVAQKMKGSLSDKDIAFVKSQVTTATTRDAAAKPALDAIRAGFERAGQRAQFYRTWAETNGNINGADAAWNKYINENPMTVEDKSAVGGRKFNPDYNKDFTPYVKPQSRLQSYRDANPNAPLVREKPQSITKDQYDALPSGSTFMAPDGTMRVKP